MASKVEASLFWFSKLLLLPRLQLPLPRCKACCISGWKKKLHLVKCLALRCYAFYIDAFDQNPFEATVAKKCHCYAISISIRNSIPFPTLLKLPMNICIKRSLTRFTYLLFEFWLPNQTSESEKGI